MKVCLYLEGSYPHVTGGVSTWVQILIKNMPEYEFIIYSIGAEEKYRGAYKYKLPENVVSVQEVFLDEMLKNRGQYGKRYRLSKDEIINLKFLITGQKVQWSYIFKLMAEKRIKNEMDFFMSHNFFDILREAYTEKFSSVPFTEFFWTVRSMLVPLFFLLNNKLPKADLYHSAANGYAGLLAAMAKFIYKKPMLLTEHGIYSREREEEIIKSTWAKGYFKDMWIKFFYNICNCVYGLSDEVLTLFEKNKEIEIELGCPAEKIKIIPNGIDIEAFAGIESEEPEESQSRNDYINIATITRIVPIKDIKTMIQSFNFVKNVIKNAKFFIFGPIDEDEEYFLECKQLADRLGLDDLTFTGKVDVRDYIKDIDILVMTSISEGQPFVILEGMAAKKPFVTTDVGGCQELLYGNNDGFGKAGLVEPVMDIEKIAKAIIRLCKNNELRKKMGENGFNRVSGLYGYKKCVESYRTIYQRFLKYY
ncbi:MAG: GT4 family glycosyltransferase PelF [Actinobacteria bacterium]|nr:GT4 family glycosyltransferase PelF [Actinomycetota bacterium]